MSSDIYTLEPFPAFVDIVEPYSNGNLSNMGILHLLSPSGAVQLRQKQDDITSSIHRYLALRYYQYEVTFGLYIMTSTEKTLCHFMILAIFTAISYALYFGLQPFLVRSICKAIYLLGGSYSGVEDLCSGPTCS